MNSMNKNDCYIYYIQTPHHGNLAGSRTDKTNMLCQKNTKPTSFPGPFCCFRIRTANLTQIIRVRTCSQHGSRGESLDH